MLLAAVGGPKWDTTDPGAPRPEAGLLGIRKGLGLYTNLRPVQIFDALAGASTLKPEVIEGVDLMIVRELTGGLYFGKRERFYDEEGAGTDGAKGQRAYDTLEYREYEVERIARQAFEAARKRRGKVTSVDKANVLETSRMWREIVHRIGEQEYPDVQIEDLLVDNTAMQLINRPADFDVVVTENMFGDILSDEAAQITGSLGMLASASLGERGGRRHSPCGHRGARRGLAHGRPEGRRDARRQGGRLRWHGRSGGLASVSTDRRGSSRCNRFTGPRCGPVR